RTPFAPRAWRCPTPSHRRRSWRRAPPPKLEVRCCLAVCSACDYSLRLVSEIRSRHSDTGLSGYLFERESRNGIARVKVCRQTDVAPPLGGGVPRRVGTAEIVECVAPKQQMSGRTVVGGQTQDDLGHFLRIARFVS